MYREKALAQKRRSMLEFFDLTLYLVYEEKMAEL
jgi:hypothetical protein